MVGTIRKCQKAVIAALCLSFMLVFILAGCGVAKPAEPAPEAKTDTTDATAKEPDKTAGKSAKDLKVGVVWSGKSSQADTTLAGFEGNMKKIAPEANIEVKKEVKSIEELATTVSGWEKEKDAVVILRSNGVEWLGKSDVKVPVFIGGCNRPDLVGLKDIENRKISGTSYYLPKKDQFITFKMILPKLDSIMLLVDPKNASSQVDIEETKQVCQELGIKYNETLCASSEEAIKASENSAGKVSAIILGSQALVYDSTKDIVAKAGKTPVLSYYSSSMKQGALLGFAADDEKLGSMLAQSLSEVMIKGKTFKEVPIKYDITPRLIINETTAKNLGITIPQTIMASAKLVK